MKNYNLIIPTFNRPHYLLRILDYYSKQGADFKIIVADSSFEENKKKNKEIISSFPNLDIRHIDNYPSEIKWYQKYSDSLNYAEEKYSVFCADDDFITLNGIEQSINFLENNSDFTVVQGYYIAFLTKSGKGKAKKFCWRPCEAGKSIDSPDPLQRLAEHLSEYRQTTTYGVHRTDFLKMIFRETVRYATDNQFGEILPSMLTLIYGKKKCLDIFYIAREISLNSLGRTSETIRSFIKKGSYKEKYNQFKKCLTFHLNKEFQIGDKESGKVIDSAMQKFLKTYSPKDFKHFLGEGMGNIFDFLGMPFLYDKIRSIYSKWAIDSRGWEEDFPVEFTNDFNKIKSQVLNFYEEQ